MFGFTETLLLAVLDEGLLFAVLEVGICLLAVLGVEVCLLLTTLVLGVDTLFLVAGVELM